MYDQFNQVNNGYQPIMISWAEVCLNQNNISGAQVQNTTVHELGHTVGLAHTLRDTNAAMYVYANSAMAPTSNDTGAPSPGCPNRAGGLGGLGGGSMCIYGWGD